MISLYLAISEFSVPSIHYYYLCRISVKLRNKYVCLSLRTRRVKPTEVFLRPKSKRKGKHFFDSVAIFADRKAGGILATL
jgi:hypothetical protein